MAAVSNLFDFACCWARDKGSLSNGRSHMSAIAVEIEPAEGACSEGSVDRSDEAEMPPPRLRRQSTFLVKGWQIKQLRFIPFDAFKELGQIPRCGTDDTFRHKLTGAPNHNVHLTYDAFDRSKTVFIFVSHRWLRPRPGNEGHPDDKENSEHELIVDACEKLRSGGGGAPIPNEFSIALTLRQFLHLPLV